MGLFDSILDRVGDAVAEEFGGDAGGFFDGAESLLSGDGGDDGGGGSSWTDALGGFLGGGSDASEDGGGWAGAIGDMVDRFSGDGGGDGLFSSVVDRVSSFLPADIREQAESLFNGEGGASSWAGSLLDRASEAIPDGWQSVASAAVGHSFGEGGFDALLPQSLGALTGVDPGVPRSMTAPLPSNGDQQMSRDDFDDLVTGGMTAGGDAPSIHIDGAVESGTNAVDDNDGMPDDPTFPADDLVTQSVVDQPDVAPQPMDEFEQAVHDADEIDDSFDAMLEGLE